MDNLDHYLRDTTQLSFNLNLNNNRGGLIESIQGQTCQHEFQ